MNDSQVDKDFKRLLEVKKSIELLAVLMEKHRKTTQSKSEILFKFR